MARDQACKGLDPMELEVRHRRWILAAVLSGSFLASLNSQFHTFLIAQKKREQVMLILFIEFQFYTRIAQLR